MILLVSSAHPTIAQYAGHPNIGRLCVPDDYARTDETAALMPWAADNGAYSGFDAEKFDRMLNRLAGVANCRFVACPDVVGDAAATFDLFASWSSGIRRRGLPVALVAQDGLERYSVPWWQIDALFVGGTTLWKMSDAARELVAQAKSRRRWVHFGRVNSMRRLTYARAIGCDSADGSKFSRWRNTYLPRTLGWLAESGTQLHMEEKCV